MTYTHPQQGQANAAALRKAAGKRLKELREAVEKTQRDVSMEVGFDYYTMISQIENGKTRIPPDHIVAYAKALKIKPKQFAKMMLQYYDPISFEILFTDKHY